MYLYENHLGGLYTSDELLDEESLYCETCGDSDMYIGRVKEEDSIADVYKLIYDICLCDWINCDDDEKCDQCPLCDYSGGYTKEAVIKIFKELSFSEEEINSFFQQLIAEKTKEKLKK